MEGMPDQAQVPEYRRLFNPVLQALKALGGSASIEELEQRVASDMKLPDGVLAVPHAGEHGGRSEFAYRLAWARTYLKNAGLITNSERGVWSLTPEGSRSVESTRRSSPRKCTRRPRATDLGESRRTSRKI